MWCYTSTITKFLNFSITNINGQSIFSLYSLEILQANQLFPPDNYKQQSRFDSVDRALLEANGEIQTNNWSSVWTGI